MASRAPRWPDGGGRRDDATRIGGAGEAMHAVSRLLGSAADAAGPAAVAETLVREAGSFFRVSTAILLSVAELEGRCEVAAMEPADGASSGLMALADLPAVAAVVREREEQALSGDEAAALCRSLGVERDLHAALLLPVRARESVNHVLILADESEQVGMDAERLEVAQAFADAAAAGMAQLELAAERAAQTARQAALARAARTLNETLDLNRVLVRICEEAASILDGDYANVFLGNAEDGLRIEATSGMQPVIVGGQVDVGQGLVGKVVERDEPMLTNDYGSLPHPAPLREFGRVRSALAVPMHWDGELRGALSVGYFRPQLVTREHLALLEAFGDLAAAACRNASAHAGLELAARTDSLTGCLNHAALHDTLVRELERAGRTGHAISLAIVDLDEFKQVNERHGHLAGDEMLRCVGRALRRSVRNYDLVARYGGDEFAIVAIDAGERAAADVATRAIEEVASEVGRLDYPGDVGGATAGVAEWRAGEASTDLLARADRALLYGKQQGARGRAVRAAEVPEAFMPVGRSRRGDDDHGRWSDREREQTERLRKRSRQLALANSLGTRLARLGNSRDVANAAVDELHRAFEYFLTAVLRVREDGYVESVAVRGLAVERLGAERWAQPVDSGLIGRAVRERRPVGSGDVRVEPDYRLVPAMVEVCSELATPIWVGERLWGVIDVEEVRPNAFDDDDARFLQTVARQIGSALQAAGLRSELDWQRAGMIGALRAALEARIGPRSETAEDLAPQVARRLGMSEREVHAVGTAARFHDLGKLSLPEALLDKEDELTEDERVAIASLPVASERLLSPVELPDGVRQMVRHAHERYDGSGAPDGLAGDAIPLGSRVILACVAYQAMLEDRPYRPARTPEDARAELRRAKGAQFDPMVVDALLAELDAQGPADSESSAARHSRSTAAG